VNPVVVIGDANVDLEIVLPDASHGGTHAHPEPQMFGGGSAANTAAALARLDVPVSFIGTVGNDDHGRFAIASLDEAGVNTRGITTTSDDPTVMVIVVVQADGERLIYVWPPSGGAQSALTSEHAIASTASASWLHVSGLCLRTNPARDAILLAMEHARANGIPVSFDLNLRLENWGWDGDFRSVVETAIDHADIVFGNGDDEILPLAGESDIPSAASKIAGMTRLVVARLGKDGAMGVGAGSMTASPGFPTSVVDTVGAGDAFNAGFIAAHLSGLPLEQRLRQGNAVASLAIQHRGARSTPSQQEARRLLAT